MEKKEREKHKPPGTTMSFCKPLLIGLLMVSVVAAMGFTPRLSSKGMAGSKWWYSDGNPFYTSGYGMPNCTCYAYGRYAEIRNDFATLPTGNAGTWWNNANSFNKGDTPQLGAIACFASKSGNYAGHVAVVEQIKENGDIVTSNSAYKGTYFWTETLKKSNDYLANWMKSSRDYYLQGFIYNDETVTGAFASAYVVAAMCGCWYRESNVNPGVWESLKPTAWNHQYQYDGIGGYGLGQWTNVGTPYGRCWKLHEYVTSHGYQDGDGNGQLAFLVYEDYWGNSSTTKGDYTSLDEFLSTTSEDLDDLVWDFLANWEGAPGNAYEQRLNAANKFLDYILEHEEDDPDSYTWVSKNNYLTWDEMYNNVMCVYFWFTNGTPAPTPEKKGMPIWMYLKYFKM